MVVGRYPTAHCAPEYAASRGGVGEYGRRGGLRQSLRLHYSKKIIGKILLALWLFCFNT